MRLRPRTRIIQNPFLKLALYLVLLPPTYITAQYAWTVGQTC